MVLSFGSNIIHRLVSDVLPHVTDVHYFCDGMRPQYKKYKNFLHWSCHKEDFHVTAEWWNSKDTKFYISDFLNNGDIYIFIKKRLQHPKNCLTSLTDTLEFSHKTKLKHWENFYFMDIHLQNKNHKNWWWHDWWYHLIKCRIIQITTYQCQE